MALLERPYPSFFMYKDDDGDWRWRFQAKNRLILAVSSEGYRNRADCRAGITALDSPHPVWLPTELVSAA